MAKTMSDSSLKLALAAAAATDTLRELVVSVKFCKKSFGP
jgi:hypothetical protein